MNLMNHMKKAGGELHGGAERRRRREAKKRPGGPFWRCGFQPTQEGIEA